jgi:hypothetical protein
VAGVAAAIAAVELGLRQFESPNGPPFARIAADSFELPTITYRQLEEGITVSHFSAAGARLTGNVPIRRAPMIALLGDSYVMAAGVTDAETMGSRLERLGRADGDSINVRQYGWLGASPSRYLLVPEVLEQRWHPRAIVIALSDNDLDDNALFGASPQLRVRHDTTLEMVPPIDSNPSPGRPRVSSLGLLLEVRTWRLHWFQFAKQAQAAEPVVAQAGEVRRDVLPTSDQLALLPAAVVRSLHAAYGERLSLVYLATVNLTGGDSTTRIERTMLAECAREHLRCASTRAGMLAERRNGHIAHGFSTTTPGNGHMNAVGHEIAAREIWSLIHR